MFKSQKNIRTALIAGVLLCCALHAIVVVWNFGGKAKSPDENIEVFVVTHSHCDPGWTFTWEQYYDSRVKYILRGVVTALIRDERRTFTWADISFLAIWSVTRPIHPVFAAVTSLMPSVFRMADEGDDLFDGPAPHGNHSEPFTWREALRHLVRQHRLDVVHGAPFLNPSGEGSAAMSDVIAPLTFGISIICHLDSLSLSHRDEKEEQGGSGRHKEDGRKGKGRVRRMECEKCIARGNMAGHGEGGKEWERASRAIGRKLEGQAG